MAKSLNPNATPPGGLTPPLPPRTESESIAAPRRNVLASVAAVIIGSFVGIVPFAAGLATFLDPLWRNKKSSGDVSGPPFRRVATLGTLPTDGTPIQVPVIADLTDAWNREANQPIGAVYLRREGDKVHCFNAICPHAGCFVGYAAERKVFQCPCHTSSFELDGTRIGDKSPSPRNMDELAVDPEKLKAGEVWVQFVNYYPGKEDRVEKPQ
jgi:Rieske Fe-S protein